MAQIEGFPASVVSCLSMIIGIPSDNDPKGGTQISNNPRIARAVTGEAHWLNSAQSLTVTNSVILKCHS